jgi:N-acetylglucosaminyl-diphospho-decaprenol L-rhamnosyltransferase
MPGSGARRLSVVVVTYNSREAVAAALPKVCEELGETDELVVVDNASTDGTTALVAELAPQATLLRNRTNAGFAAAANAGARAARGALLVFLNPDATPRPGFAEAIARPLADGREWTGWMGLVTTGAGREINTSGGVIHFTGIAWAGEAGKPADAVHLAPREVGFLSGACLAVSRDTWLRCGGFAEQFFMYHEDVDLSLRLRLAGGRLGVEPAAVVEHDYEFAKGHAKWRLLERNRWATIVRCYPAPLLALLTPALAACELAVVASAASGGWLPEKGRAAAETLRALPGLRRERREIQAARAVSAAEFATWLTADLSSPYLGRIAASRGLNLVLRAYWRVVLGLLGAGRSSSR